MTHITPSVAPVVGQFLECPYVTWNAPMFTVACVWCVCACVCACVCVCVYVCISYLSLPEASWIAEQLDCTTEDAVLIFHDKHIP